MKKIIRLLILLLLLSSVAGITTSCAVFNSSHAQKNVSFKHKNPLPKRYILHTGYKPIVK